MGRRVIACTAPAPVAIMGGCSRGAHRTRRFGIHSLVTVFRFAIASSMRIFLIVCFVALCLPSLLVLGVEIAQWVLAAGLAVWAGVVLWKAITHPLETLALLSVVGGAAMLLSAYERFIEPPDRQRKSQGYGRAQIVPHPLGEKNRWSPPMRTDRPTIG